ncbi:MAG: hypothetical protein L0338_19955, partial [Acidobacteria bacterium]|nr:hypothetical protein [Acidobacteriota bacterium]
AAGTAMGANVLMMSGGNGDDPFEKIGRPGRSRPGSNQAQNEQVRSLAKKYNLSREQQRQLHDYIQGEDLGYADLEQIIRQLFPNNIPGG